MKTDELNQMDLRELQFLDLVAQVMADIAANVSDADSDRIRDNVAKCIEEPGRKAVVEVTEGSMHLSVTFSVAPEQSTEVAS